jgi:hypothetical protein
VTRADDWIEWMRRKAEHANGQPAHQGQQAASDPVPGQQPFTTESVLAKRQGSSERTRSAQPGPGFGSRTGPPASRAARGRDESDPRKPTDPPWRGRTARRTSTPEAMRALRGGPPPPRLDAHPRRRGNRCQQAAPVAPRARTPPTFRVRCRGHHHRLQDDGRRGRRAGQNRRAVGRKGLPLQDRDRARGPVSRPTAPRATP